MRKIFSALALIGSLFASPAHAANFTAKDASAATITFVNPQNCTTGCVPIFSWYDSTGANAVAVVTAGADGASNTANGGLAYARNLVFNGATWDRWQGAVTNAGTFAVQLTGATNNINNIAGTVSLPTGAATAAKQPALGTAGAASVDVLTVQGVASMTPFLSNPGTAANWGVGTSTQNSSTVANGQLALAQFNTAPTTISTGNMSPLQMDNAGNLLVNIKAGAGSGGTALADGATFTEATTSFTPVGGEYVSGGGANCTTGKGCTLQMTIDRAAYTNSYKWAGGVLGAMANYGTSPGAVLAPGVNAFVTNSNANGQATMANSSPVVLASNQSNVPANIAQVGGASVALGSTTASASIPVVIASNQTAADPCMFQNKTNLPISQSGTSSVQLIALSGSTVIYVCSLSLIAAGATTAVLTTGTGSACVTGNAAVLGDTTANIANGLSFAANGGLTMGNGGGTIMKGAASSELCMTLGTNVRMSGNLTYVQQ